MTTRLARLRALRKAANYESAGFGRIHPDPADPLPTSEAEVTRFIIERTKLYRGSYVLPIIDELVRAEEQKIATRKKR